MRYLVILLIIGMSCKTNQHTVYYRNVPDSLRVKTIIDTGTTKDWELWDNIENLKSEESVALPHREIKKQYGQVYLSISIL